MEINKQLFEDVLSGKLKGTFILKNGFTIKSNRLVRCSGDFYVYGLRGFLNSFTPLGKSSSARYDIVNFIPDMKQNELTIEIPDNKVVDWEESKKQNKIVLKDKQLTYKDICKKLLGNSFYFTDSDGEILDGSCAYTSNCAKTEHQLECILAKNMLANVAKYLNDGCNLNDDKYYVIVYGYGKDAKKPRIEIIFKDTVIYGFIVFKTKELAQQAIEILGEETIKLALEPLGI